MESRYLTSPHLILLSSQLSLFTLRERTQKLLHYQFHRNMVGSFLTMISMHSSITVWLSLAYLHPKKKLRRSLNRCKNNIIKSLSLLSLKNRSSLNLFMTMSLYHNMILAVNSTQRLRMKSLDSKNTISFRNTINLNSIVRLSINHSLSNLQFGQGSQRTVLMMKNENNFAELSKTKLNDSENWANDRQKR